MGDHGCQCEFLKMNCTVREERWREICTKFYFNHDETAKRVLEYFEASKRDEMSISTEENATDDGECNELVRMLGLQKCTVPGHEEISSQTIQMLEVVKNNVRAGYHAHVSNERYAGFDGEAKKSQGTNLELWTDGNGQEKLSVRIQHDYMRSIENHNRMINCVKMFIKNNLRNVGCHPFLAGLRAVLQWNLESSTVVAWKLSDSVFVESGDAEFAHNALGLLVVTLNFNHCENGVTSSHDSESRVKIRHWYLDPFISDNDIRQLLRLFPASKRLEGRPTGTKITTMMDRVNVHGQRDERRKFFKRWCVIL